MATWLIPALKIVIPFIEPIVKASAPYFTKKGVVAGSDPTQLLQQQISELQSAASKNATHVKVLAEQLQSTVAAIEQAALVAEAKHQRAWRVSLSALVLSAISLCVVVLHVLVL
jgi:hypothetical protein